MFVARTHELTGDAPRCDSERGCLGLRPVCGVVVWTVERELLQLSRARVRLYELAGIALGALGVPLREKVGMA